MDAFWPALTAVALGLAVAALVFVVVRLGAGAEPGAAARWHLGEHATRMILLTIVGVTTVLAIVAFSRVSGFPLDRVAFSGMGALLIGLTLLRPPWFWEHAKARWLRGLVGDSGAAALYLILGVLLVLTGLFTTIPFGRGR